VKFLLCSFLHPLATSSILGPDILPQHPVHKQSHLICIH